MDEPILADIQPVWNLGNYIGQMDTKSQSELTDGAEPRCFQTGERSHTGAGECVWHRMGNDLWFDNDTPALNALTALRGAPTSMGRGEIPVELQPAAIHLPVSFYSKTIYRPVRA